jgi:hypothetical protein
MDTAIMKGLFPMLCVPIEIIKLDFTLLKIGYRHALA